MMYEIVHHRRHHHHRYHHRRRRRHHHHHRCHRRRRRKMYLTLCQTDSIVGDGMVFGGDVSSSSKHG